jgi:transcriptional regulator with XRE-family HTH domain
VDPEEIRRRVKAARALAGISVKELAERINQEGLGERTLRALEGDAGRAWRPMELQAVAQACGLPYEFFTVDFSSVFDRELRVDDRLDELERRLRRLEGVQAAPAPPGELGRRAEGSQPNGGHRPQDERREEEGQSRGAGG